MTTKKRLYARYSLVFTLVFPAIVFADECDAILQQGVRNTFQELRTGDFNSSFKSAYCNKNSTNKGSSSGTDVGGSYAGYGLNFGQSSSDTAQTRAENCGNASSSMSEDSLVKAMRSVADKNIVDAWSSCKNSAYGVLILGELNGRDIILTYRFRSAGAISQATVDGTPFISGAKCDDAVKGGTVINTGGRIQSCMRNGDGPVTIAVNTSFQPARFFIPAVVKQKPSPSSPSADPNAPRNPFEGQPPFDKQRLLPGVGLAPEGYTWCIIDKQFLVGGVQSYCYARERSGSCHCATVPSYVFTPRRHEVPVVSR